MSAGILECFSPISYLFRDVSHAFNVGNHRRG
jgi:hypothetical protein